MIPGDYRILSLDDIGFYGEIEETAPDLEGNALIKARLIHEKTGSGCFADDTGLEVDFLEGRPGVHSARYAGEYATYADNVNKLLGEMDGAENRNARFRTVIALILDGREYLFEGRVDGTILTAPRGDSGFGYDPVFVPDGYTRTFAEMTSVEKNSISHRGMAIERLLRFLAGPVQ
jgi:XTP/dITP diphosphohydrolase